MKTFVVAVNGMVFEDLSQASVEQAAHLRWLMQIGCYGKLAGIAQPAASTARAIVADIARAGMLVQTADIPSLQVQALETALNELLGSLDDDTALLLVLDSGYILTAPHSPVQGEMENASLADLEATLLELGEIAAPDWLGGKSLLSEAQASAAEQADYTEAEAEIVRKRLEGLGYI